MSASVQRSVCLWLQLITFSSFLSRMVFWWMSSASHRFPPHKLGMDYSNCTSPENTFICRVTFIHVKNHLTGEHNYSEADLVLGCVLLLLLCQHVALQHTETFLKPSPSSFLPFSLLSNTCRSRPLPVLPSVDLFFSVTSFVC